MSNLQGGKSIDPVNASKQLLPAKLSTSAAGYNSQPIEQPCDQILTTQNLDNNRTLTNTGKRGRGKPQRNFFRRIWDVFSNRDAIPARDEEEPQGDLVQPTDSTSTQSQPPAPLASSTTFINQPIMDETFTIPVSRNPQLPVLSQYPPPGPLKLEQDTVQPARTRINETHIPRQVVPQPVQISAKPQMKRTTCHDPFNSSILSNRDESTKPLTTKSIPTAPTTAVSAYSEIARDYGRPTSGASAVSNSMTNHRHRNPTLEEPMIGETWPDAPTIGVSDFRLARLMPRRPPKKDLVRLHGSKPRICDNAGCSGYHSHDHCPRPRQCKGCGSLEHYWGMCKSWCNLCGAQQHTAELCFTVPVGEDRKQRSGNPDGYRRRFFCEPKARGPAFEVTDPWSKSSGSVPKSHGRDSSRRPEVRFPRPEDGRPWAHSGRRNSAYEDRDSWEQTSGRMPQRDHRGREGRWGQAGPYLMSDEQYGHLGRYEVSGRKRSADTNSGRLDSSRPAKRKRIEEEDEA